MMFVFFLLFSANIYTSGAILCYWCSDLNAEGYCKNDIGVLTINNSRNFPHLFKSCAKHDWGDQCSIETVREAGSGKIKSFFRGCTDGKVFSFGDFPERTVVPDNQTTCAYRPGDGKVVVCLTVCKSTLCNGPQLVDPKHVGVVLHSGASMNHFCYMLNIIMFLLTWCILFGKNEFSEESRFLRDVSCI